MTLTTEWLKERLKNPRSGTEFELINEVLANREARPVFFIDMAGGDWINVDEIPGNTFDFNNLPDGINFLYTAPPAPALQKDVEAVVSLLEAGEWAEHCTNTEVGQRLESAVTALVSDATPAPAVPDGFKLVPTVPTPEMIAAAMNCDDVTFNADETFCVNFGNIYAAMLAAAPGQRE